MTPTIELLAVVASAVYGTLRGVRAKFDVVGLISVAAATAFGGGTLRDLVLDRRPLFWVENEYLLWVVLVVAGVGAFVPRKLAKVEPLLVLPDAIGLGLFTVAGASVALAAGMSSLVAVALGVVTGTFGGVICDIICNETPTLFRTSPLCATCSLLGAVLFLGLTAADAPAGIAQWVGTIAAAVLRVLAVWRGWTVPSRTLGPTRV